MLGLPTYILMLLFVFSVRLHSQTEVKDSISAPQKDIRYSPEAETFLGKAQFTADWCNSVQFVAEPPNYLSLNWRETSTGRYELEMPPLEEILYPPLLDRYATSYPYTYDYGFYGYKDLADDVYVTASSNQNVFPTMGTVRTVGASLSYDVTRWLTISGGSYISKYTAWGGLYRDVGTNASMRFYLGDRVRLNTFGQYSVYGKSNGIGYLQSGMYPQSHYGGSFELKISGHIGVEVGVLRELDPLSGKWKDVPFVNPVFYYGKKH